MIEFRNVTKAYGAQDLLIDASFRVGAGERVGIVGPNGAGKSTLFRLIEGASTPDKGEVAVQKDIRLGHLRQQLNAHSVRETLLHYAMNAIPELDQIRSAIEEIEHRLAENDGTDRDRDLARLGDLQTRYEGLGGYNLEGRTKAALGGLGFRTEEFDRPFTSFSGGWQMRAELVRVLVGHPDLLLLDEPSNYLDLPAVEWLEKFLRGFPGTMLLISHDRFLLQSLTQVTIEVASGRATRYACGYDAYRVQREERHAQALAARKSQDRRIEQVERFVERFRAKNTKATQVQSRVKMLERIERVEVTPLHAEIAAMRIPPPPHCGQEVMRLEKIAHTYDGERWILRDISLSLQRGDKLALVGYNGMGKTTLQRILAGALSPVAGKRSAGHKVVVGYQSQEFSETMPPRATVLDVVKEAHPERLSKEARSLLGSFGFSGDAVDKTVEVLSGGEKIRLAFARIFVNPPNFLVLDEPTTHLDIAGRQALEQALRDYSGTLCLVSHDIAFVRTVANGVLALSPEGPRRYPGGYDYYREKSAGEAAPSAPTSEGAAASGSTRKEQRRQRAESRKAQQAETRKLKNEIQRCEQQIEELEAEQHELAQALSGDGASIDFAAVNRRLSEIQGELNETVARWEEALQAWEEMRDEGN